jgi:hypothetical protein
LAANDRKNIVKSCVTAAANLNATLPDTFRTTGRPGSLDVLRRGICCYYGGEQNDSMRRDEPQMETLSEYEALLEKYNRFGECLLLDYWSEKMCHDFIVLLDNIWETQEQPCHSRFPGKKS